MDTTNQAAPINDSRQQHTAANTVVHTIKNKVLVEHGTAFVLDRFGFLFAKRLVEEALVLYKLEDDVRIGFADSIRIAKVLNLVKVNGKDAHGAFVFLVFAM